MQGITPELEALLKARYQAAASGFRGRVELDLVAIESTTTNVALGKTVTMTPLAPGGETCPTAASPSDAATNGNVSDYTRVDSHVGGHGAIHGADWSLDLGIRYEVDFIRLKLIVGVGGGNVLPDPTVSPSATNEWRGNLQCSDDGVTWTDVSVSYSTTGTLDSLWGVWTLDAPATHRYWQVQARWTAPPGLQFIVYCGFGEWEINGLAFETTVTTIDLPPPTSIGIDKSLRRAADAAEVEIPNEGLALGWATTSEIITNSRARIFQWYGDRANEVRTFTGLVDDVKDHRDLLATTLSLRDMFAILVDQTFVAASPQKAGEAGAVRTKANGVYLSMEVSAIVDDILDRVGWPTADRAVTTTSYVLDEYLLADGSSYADNLIGSEKLTGLVGYSAWADELGVFHFAPTLLSQRVTDPVDPVYTFRAGEDVLALDDLTSQFPLRTRVKTRGPLTRLVLTDTWREVWRTSKFRRPAGLWHDPADASYLRVLDRGTKRIYRLRLSDRAVVSSVNIGAVVTHPLGISGDPSSSTIYWLLQAPWIDGGSGGNQIVKVRKSDNHVLARYSLPSGNWSAIKVSSAWIYLTNLSTDRVYRRSKTDGSAHDDFRHTYASVLQSNPSGVMIDGTSIAVFWANGGTTARFLECSESAPGTVTNVVKTVGTVLHGGEIDAVNPSFCYGDSDSLGLVAKFQRTAAVSQTDQVFSEVVDTALEDELGARAQLEPRIHDTHSSDGAHPYEVRRMTLDLRVITSLAQATETAQRQLDLVSRRARTLDVGIVGNPALQKTDPVAVVDVLTSLSDGFTIDTYRSRMDAAGTYVGTLALVPVDAIDDDPTDDGDATE